jgi:hypothetical protein
MNKALQILARQMGEEDVSSCAELEAKLTPLLRLVLRTGQGYPSLLQWVQSALPAVVSASRLGGQVDPEWAAPYLARLLCSQLLRDFRAQRGTMVNRQTVVASHKRGASLPLTLPTAF